MIIFIVVSIIILFFVFSFINVRRGHLISKYLFQFERIYEAVLSESGSKQKAMQQALQVFKNCPRLNVLTDEELEKVATIIKEADDPKKIIPYIVLNFDSKKTVKVLRDEVLLKKIINAFQ